MDTDSAGVLDKKRMGKALKKFGHKNSVAEVELILAKFHLDANVGVDLVGFLTVHSARPDDPRFFTSRAIPSASYLDYT